MWVLQREKQWHCSIHDITVLLEAHLWVHLPFCFLFTQFPDTATSNQPEPMLAWLGSALLPVLILNLGVILSGVIVMPRFASC